MRGIKFRGKDIETGQWVYGFYVRLEDSLRKPIDGKERISHRIYTGFADSCASCDGYDFSEDWHEVDPNTVGQYTELTGKNGKEIYEGDILCTPFSSCMIVLFGMGSFHINTVFGATHYFDGWADKIEQFEVIGNIHDNPELLKETEP